MFLGVIKQLTGFKLYIFLQDTSTDFEKSPLKVCLRLFWVHGGYVPSFIANNSGKWVGHFYKSHFFTLQPTHLSGETLTAVRMIPLTSQCILGTNNWIFDTNIQLIWWGRNLFHIDAVYCSFCQQYHIHYLSLGNIAPPSTIQKIKVQNIF